jgi:hypothetical protein
LQTPTRSQRWLFANRKNQTHQGRKYGAADGLLLPAEMILKLVSRDVAGINAGDGVVHRRYLPRLRCSRRFGHVGELRAAVADDRIAIADDGIAFGEGVRVGLITRREIPGGAAMAANEQSVVYEGAFGFPDAAAASRMSTDPIIRIASMVKLPTSRRAPIRGARQAGAERASRQHRSDAQSAKHCGNRETSKLNTKGRLPSSAPAFSVP